MINGLTINFLLLSATILLFGAGCPTNKELLQQQQKQIGELNRKLENLTTSSTDQSTSTRSNTDIITRENNNNSDVTEKVIYIKQNNSESIKKLEEKIKQLESQPPTVKEISTQNTPDIPTIINQWRPRITKITCEWHYKDSDEAYAWASGSGLLINKTDSKDGSMLVVVTNRHVITLKDRYTPRLCELYFPGITDTFQILDIGDEYAFRTSVSGLDFGDIRLFKPNAYIQQLASTNIAICKEVAPIGEQVLILGYPTVGSQSGLTVTEGIISGYDDEYYITSAKVEHGNSGGVAISVKNNCYLGIPSFVQAGELESLARILKVQSIFDSY